MFYYSEPTQIVFDETPQAVWTRKAEKDHVLPHCLQRVGCEKKSHSFRKMHLFFLAVTYTQISIYDEKENLVFSYQNSSRMLILISTFQQAAG